MNKRLLSLLVALSVVTTATFSGGFPVFAGNEETKETDVIESVETSILESVDKLLDKKTATASESEYAETPEVIEAETEDQKATSSDIVLTATAEDGTMVTLNADADAFPYENLDLVAHVATGSEAEHASEEIDAEKPDENTAKRVTYDIQVQSGGVEVQPAGGKKVNVSFKLADVPSGADEATVYHHDETTGDVEEIVTTELTDDTAAVDSAETRVSVGEDAKITTTTAANDSDEEYLEDYELENDLTVSGETTSFSLYTVDFTYDDKQISIAGGSDHNELSGILASIGITDAIVDATACMDEACTQPAPNNTVAYEGKDLFRVYAENGKWYVDAINAFSTTHGLFVKTADANYKVRVTDDFVSGAIEIKVNGIATASYPANQFTEAFRALKNYSNPTMVLNDNIVANSGNIGSNGYVLEKTFTLDLNGKTLDLNKAHLNIDGEYQLDVKNGTITNGSSTDGNSYRGRGGAIRNYRGTLNVDGVTFTNNYVYDYGGAISNDGKKCTIQNSEFYGNHGVYGGAVYNNTEMTMTNCIIHDNYVSSSDNTRPSFGGGVGNFGNLVMDNCTIATNSCSGGSGGGISNYGKDNLTLKECIIRNNKASGGIYIAGSGSYQQGCGGGILSYGVVNIEDSTIQNNSAQNDGGGVYCSGLDGKSSTAYMQLNVSGKAVIANNTGSRGSSNVALCNADSSSGYASWVAITCNFNITDDSNIYVDTLWCDSRYCMSRRAKADFATIYNYDTVKCIHADNSYYSIRYNGDKKTISTVEMGLVRYTTAGNGSIEHISGSPVVSKEFANNTRIRVYGSRLQIEGEEAIVATPSAGSIFDRWEITPNKDLVQGDTEIKAVFKVAESVQVNSVIHDGVDNKTYGEVYPKSTVLVEKGSTIHGSDYNCEVTIGAETFTAVAKNEGWFNRWEIKKGGNPATWSDSASENVELTAYFIYAGDGWSVSFASSSNGSYDTSFGGDLAKVPKKGATLAVRGNTIIFGGGRAYATAVPDAGYEFAGWYDVTGGQGQLLSEGMYTDNISSDMVLKATFKTPDTPIRPSGGGGSSVVGALDKTNYHAEHTYGSMDAPINDGLWELLSDGTWKYNWRIPMASAWGCIVNPYANTTSGQAPHGWFFFNPSGIMLTGWRLVDGKWYYLEPISNGCRGQLYTNTTTPDGYKVDENGAWIE